MTSYQAVIGLGFGDEGKGKTTNFLCLQNPNALVVRYSGGQQAGHTVVLNGIRHVFSNFGSGFLNGNPTYWSPYCTIDPVGIMNELSDLLNLSNTSILYIDAECPVTIPLDKFRNQALAEFSGTCGVGVGATHQREEDFYSLKFKDLFYPKVLEYKLKLIKDFYYKGMGEINESYMDKFLSSVDMLINLPQSIQMVYKMPEYDSTIFEGSQGLLLDQHYGFFPHVTRSNVGSPNICALTNGKIPTFYGVTRAYQTRHGKGPMTNEEIPHKILSNPLETNVYNPFQGQFKKSLLDVDLLEYAISSDKILRDHRDVLVINCLDHIANDLRFTHNGTIVECATKKEFIERVQYLLYFSEVLVGESDCYLDNY